MKRYVSIFFTAAVSLFFAAWLFSCGGGDGGSGGTVTSDNNVIFVTSVTGDGDLGSWADAGGDTGLAAADAICQARADAAGLTGTFFAWLSDDNNDAYCRVHNLTGKKASNCGQGTLPASAGPWVRTDGVKVADNRADLTDGFLFTSINQDETGIYIGKERVFTGSDEAGITTVNTCSDWADGTNTFNGSFDRSSGAGVGWSGGVFNLACDFLFHLYCFED